MHFPKITVVTVCFNAEGTIERCIKSVLSQDYPNLEYVIVDGGSTDGTVPIISKYKNRINIFISEPDNGIYDAMNKGIAFSSGEITGMLNADDFLTGENILTVVHETFKKDEPYIVYGDLDYIDGAGRVIRKWRSGQYKHGMFNYGWMPPHPTFYCKTELFEKLGNYQLVYGTAADYELMLRFMHLHKLPAAYIPMVMVKMAAGGVSNQSISNRLKALKNDLKAMYKNGVFLPPIALLFKPLRKIKQFF
ncbi:glycosyltransferase family 2 protein [Mucilaginibacter litoreus]|uniref:glycosyltransferase family 2 protein n=1 Tax=Mucilaginibacter litoreus TaxID=1048221 RepID=UPI00366D5E26